MGVGQFLGEVMESEAVELLAVTSGFQGLTAVIELIAAEIVLTQGVSRALELWLLPAVDRTYVVHGSPLFPAPAAMDSGAPFDDQRSHRTNGRAPHPTCAGSRQKWHEGEDEELSVIWSSRRARTPRPAC